MLTRSIYRNKFLWLSMY